jgi:hypothetical protein
MTAGNQPSVAGVNSTAGALSTQLRTLFQQIQNFQAWLSAYGGANALTALGFTAADSATIVSTIGNLNTLASVYAGTATQPAVFNYEANSNALWGGQ